jgi:hypothetical protein
MAVVGPKGNLLLMVSGEGKKDLIDACIQQALKFYPPETFRYDPIPISLERDKTGNGLADTGLRFPAKLAFDDSGDRLFISDSNHNRILVTSSDGAFIDAIGSGRIGSGRRRTWSWWTWRWPRRCDARWAFQRWRR